MFTYTLGFIKYKNQILMINRKKKPWLGCWNGLGGKLKDHEDQLSSLKRELHEETGLTISDEEIKDCGYLTWNSFDANGQGLYIYLIELKHAVNIEVPKQTDEGILDWKDIDWIIDPSNLGVAHNIRFFLPTVLHEQNRYHYHCTFDGDRLISVTKELI